VISSPPRQARRLAKVVSRSATDELTGIEFCAGIPAVSVALSG